MKHYEDGKSFLQVQLFTHVRIVYGGSDFRKTLRFFILDESNEKFVTDILKLEDIFLKTILLNLYHSDCSFLSQRMKCGWR